MSNASTSIAVVKEMCFPQHLISRFDNLHWPTRSPDLTVLVTSSYRVFKNAQLTIVNLIQSMI